MKKGNYTKKKKKKKAKHKKHTQKGRPAPPSSPIPFSPLGPGLPLSAGHTPHLSLPHLISPSSLSATAATSSPSHVIAVFRAPSRAALHKSRRPARAASAAPPAPLQSRRTPPCGPSAVAAEPQTAPPSTEAPPHLNCAADRTFRHPLRITAPPLPRNPASNPQSVAPPLPRNPASNPQSVALSQAMAAARVLSAATGAAASALLFQRPLRLRQGTQSLSFCFNKGRSLASRAIYNPEVRVKEEGLPETLDYRVFFIDNSGKKLSPWHDVPLQLGDGVFNFVVEIPKESSAKMEVATDEPYTPIKQDTKKGKLRYYPYNINWNYGLLPQTWEDPSLANSEVEGAFGDNDPVDVVEIGETQRKIGQILQVKPLAALAMIDEGELDWKIVAISLDDPKASLVNDVDDVEKHFPGTLTAIRDWFRDYKIPDGKPANKFGLGNKAASKEYALEVITETNESWSKLVKRSTPAGELSLV